MRGTDHTAMSQLPAASPIAGAVLPLGRAESLIATLQSVVSVRIVASENGVVDAVHVLVSGELTPKQVVRNVESALMAQLGMKIDHRKISVATTTARPTPPTGADAQAATPANGRWMPVCRPMAASITTRRLCRSSPRWSIATPISTGST